VKLTGGSHLSARGREGEEAGLRRVGQKGRRAARGKRKKGGREERWAVG
jgi:hypothetical protein